MEARLAFSRLPHNADKTEPAEATIAFLSSFPILNVLHSRLNTTLHLALEQKYLYFAQISRGRKFHKKYHICAIFLMEHKQQQS